jgi:DNA adenine methylase
MGNGGSTFIKWAGGKTQLLAQLEPLLPKKIDRYFEPFLGSGAVFFFIVQKYEPKEVLLSDTNEYLIITYQVIKEDVTALIKRLKQHKAEYNKDPKTYYYVVREQNPSTLSKIDIAARLIFLNRTCFNGLYRVNSKGKFNVPIGNYKNPDIVQEEKLLRVSKLLKKVTLKVLSFEEIVPLAKKGDFVYFDPPYYPLHRASFTKYTKDDFLELQQESLKEVFDALTTKKVLCMESNSDTKFIRDLYKDYHIVTVRARRLINSQSAGRGEINEVVILNYP